MSGNSHRLWCFVIITISVITVYIRLVDFSTIYMLATFVSIINKVIVLTTIIIAIVTSYQYRTVTFLHCIRIQYIFLHCISHRYRYRFSFILIKFIYSLFQ